jgi:hypothetical protein
MSKQKFIARHIFRAHGKHLPGGGAVDACWRLISFDAKPPESVRGCRICQRPDVIEPKTAIFDAKAIEREHLW